MIHEAPKPTKGWKWGPSQILKPLPKFAVRLGAALTAVGVCGLGYSMIVESHPEWATIMGIIGCTGAFLTTMFGKK